MTVTPDRPAARQRPLNETRVLIACMPKSGSTFLTRTLAELPGLRRVALVPVYDRREQELCETTLSTQIRESRALRRAWRQTTPTDAPRPGGFVAQHHVKYSAATADLITRYNLRPVVLVRPLFDVVMSLHDHIKNTSPLMSMAHVTDEMRDWPQEDLCRFIAEMILPWYVSFFQSWQSCPDHLLLSYDQVMDDKASALSRVAEFAGFRCGPDDIAVALDARPKGGTRKNKGVSGRGDALPQPIKDHIRALTRHYPDTDFTILGL